MEKSFLPREVPYQCRKLPVRRRGGEEEGDGEEERCDVEEVGGETNLEGEPELGKEWGYCHHEH